MGSRLPFWDGPKDCRILVFQDSLWWLQVAGTTCLCIIHVWFPFFTLERRKFVAGINWNDLSTNAWFQWRDLGWLCISWSCVRLEDIFFVMCAIDFQKQFFFSTTFLFFFFSFFKPYWKWIMIFWKSIPGSTKHSMKLKPWLPHAWLLQSCSWRPLRLCPYVLHSLISWFCSQVFKNPCISKGSLICLHESLVSACSLCSRW